MKSKPLYRIGDKTQTVKQWACDWGISVGAAYGRLMTMSMHRQVDRVRI